MNIFVNRTHGVHALASEGDDKTTVNTASMLPQESAREKTP